jgi:superfamily II DNA/RNA helicase
LSSFSTLSLLPTLLESLDALGFSQQTEIQAQTLPALLEDRSLVGVSETGSGKTLAYVLPMLHKLKNLELRGSSVSETRHPRGLVLVPGRELGEQVSKVFKSMTHKTRVRVRTALGGSKKKVTRQSVSGTFEILVATPGRLSQLVNGGEVNLEDVRTLVFDEADQMLDPSFLPVAKAIIRACPKNVQLVMFSATLPGGLETVVHEVFPNTPLVIRTRGSQRVVPTLQTIHTQISSHLRFETLVETLAQAPDVATMAFVNTRDQLEKLGKYLTSEGISFTSYRGQMDRQERRTNLARFRNGEVSLLLATDLGGRGLDIEGVDRVINVHLPQTLDNYLHRVGRTARAGRKGLVVNLVTQRDHPLIAKLDKRA